MCVCRHEDFVRKCANAIIVEKVVEGEPVHAMFPDVFPAAYKASCCGHFCFGHLRLGSTEAALSAAHAMSHM